MASNRPRTRFTVLLNEEHRALFSVEERADGDLIVFISSEDYFSDISSDRPVSEADRYAENRVSVHRSKISDGRTVKHTMRTISGATHKTYSFIRNSKNNLCWPIFSRSVPSLAAPQYNHRPKKKDTSVSLGFLDENFSTFIYHVLVMSLNRDPPVFLESRMKYHDFRFFRLVIYSNYVNLPTWNVACVAVTGTLPQMINNIESPPLPEELSYLTN